MITATTLPAALKAAKPGDTLVLSGPFGDTMISGAQAFSPAITLTSDPANPATARTLDIRGSSGLHFHGLALTYTPDATTVDWSQCVTLDTSSDIVLDGFKIVGGPAITGIPENPSAADLAADKSGNIIGRPCARGVGALNCHNITLTNSEIVGFHRQVVLNACQGVLIQHNALHGRRTTSIAGANVSDLTIDGNVIYDAEPWRWGDTAGGGDHADCLALWSNAGQTTPNARVKITNNIMAQLSGANIMGLWAIGGVTSPFTDINVSGNLLLIPNLEGIMLADVVGGTISGNTLVQVPLPSMTAEQLSKQFPTIILQAPDVGSSTSGIAITNNGLGAPISDKSGAVNPANGNTTTVPTVDSGVTEIRAWLVNHPDMASLAAPLLQAVDPRDAQIADLTSKLSASQVALSVAQAKTVTLTAQLAKDEAKLAAARAALS